MPDEYADETLEQIEARLEAGEGLVEEPAQEPEPETAEAAEQPEQEATQEEQPPAQQEEPPAEETPEFDEVAAQNEEQRLEGIKRETESERLRFLLGRETGRAAHLFLF